MVKQTDLNKMIEYEILWFATASALLGMIFKFATVNVNVKDKIEVASTLVFPLIMIVFLVISKYSEKFRALDNFEAYYSIVAIAPLVIWSVTIGDLWAFVHFFNNVGFLILGSFYVFISLVIDLKVAIDIMY